MAASVIEKCRGTLMYLWCHPTSTHVDHVEVIATGMDAGCGFIL